MFNRFKLETYQSLAMGKLDGRLDATDPASQRSSIWSLLWELGPVLL